MTLVFDLLIWWGAGGFLGFLLMGFDKEMARKGSQRVSERKLHVVALAGGFAGVVLGAYLFHHKTRKWTFWPAVGLACALWLALLWLLSGP